MNNGWKKDYLRYKDFFLSVANVYKTKPNLKIYLELILSLSTILVFSLFAIKPTILTIIELNKEIKAKQETSLNLKQKIKNLQTANNLMQSELENIMYIHQAIPDNATPETLIKQIENLAKENSLQILGFSTSDVTLLGKDAENKKVQNELPFTFSARGTYQNIFLFLTTLENLRRPIKFDSFIINSNISEEGKVLVFTITGSVPYLHE